ncbi:hypothetical protein NQZ68_033015 [Dissostichus eleginoides]|nr:hypothetical protein NQZ68_033015 [Dissostichus eleginoides]
MLKLAHQRRPALAAVWMAAWFSGAVESDLLRSIFYTRPQWPRSPLFQLEHTVVDAAMLGCGVRRQSGKHRLNLGSAAPRAFVIWRRSSRQVAAVVHCSPCTSSR